MNENVGVNWAPIRIRHSGRAGDSGRDIFEKENLITWKIKEINRASPGFGSDSPFGSDRARGSLQGEPRRSFFLLIFVGEPNIQSQRISPTILERSGLVLVEKTSLIWRRLWERQFLYK